MIMLLKRIELLLDPRIEAIAIVAKYNDAETSRGCVPFRVNDGDRVQIYEGLKVSRRELED